MSRYLQSILSGQSKPVQRNVNLRSTPDPDTGKTVLLPTSEEAFAISQDDSADIVRVRHDQFYHCRCTADKPLGGRCFVCGGSSCVDCHTHCSTCRKPLCPEHAVIAPGPSGQGITLCEVCAHKTKQKALRQKVARLLLSPIVRFPEKEQP